MRTETSVRSVSRIFTMKSKNSIKFNLLEKSDKVKKLTSNEYFSIALMIPCLLGGAVDKFHLEFLCSYRMNGINSSTSTFAVLKKYFDRFKSSCFCKTVPMWVFDEGGGRRVIFFVISPQTFKHYTHHTPEIEMSALDSLDLQIYSLPSHLSKKKEKKREKKYRAVRERSFRCQLHKHLHSQNSLFRQQFFQRTGFHRYATSSTTVRACIFLIFRVLFLSIFLTSSI